MNDPQDDRDPDEKYLELADHRMQDQILTSVDEEAYANGDWTERIVELAWELQAEAEEDAKCAAVDHAIQTEKDYRP